MAVTLAYPLLDVLLFGFVIVAIAVNRWRADPTWLLLAAGLATTAIADAVYNYQSSIGTYVAGSALDSMWPVAVLLIAAAAWSPARPERVAGNGRRSAWIPMLFAVGAVSLLCYAGLHDVQPIAVALAAAGLGLGLFRAAMLMAENRRLLAHATQESLTDGLTGLANRRALVRDLDAYFACPACLATRTLALFDLDGFKTYNDMFGHAAGDELLAGLADRLAAAVASRATAYRLGGDEFCLLIPASRRRSCSTTRSRAERAGRAFHGHDVGRVGRHAARGAERPRRADARRRAHVRRQGRTQRQRARTGPRGAAAGAQRERAGAAPPHGPRRAARARGQPRTWACRSSRSTSPCAPPSCTTSARSRSRIRFSTSQVR